jgi:ABC-2 type transport system permease protein
VRITAKLTWTELKLFAREPFSVIFSFLFPAVVLVVLAGIFGSQPDPDFGGASPTDYYLAGYVAVVIAAIAMVALPVHVAGYRERGILRRFQASSIPGGAVVASQVAVGLAASTIGALVLIVIGVLVYDAALPGSPVVAVAIFALSTVSLLALGFLVATIAGSARAAQAIGLMLFFPMWLLSGAGPPHAVLTEGMRTVSNFLPLTYAVQALQDPWLGRPTDGTDVMVLAGILVVAGALSVRLFRTS